MHKPVVVSLLALFATPVVGAGADVAARPPVPAAQYRSLTDDGAWCWFSDPRAVFYQGQHRRTYAGWITSQGTIQVGTYDHQTKMVEVATIHEKLQVDDHDAPSLLFRPDGRLMVFYAKHGGRDMYLRISDRPEDITAWGPERRLPFEPDRNGITYANPVRLSVEKDRIYLFWRGLGYKPTYSFSDDLGGNWAQPRQLVTSPGARPYLKVASNDKDTIHLAFTDGHPRDEATNSIYYMAYRAGRFYKADGSLIADVNALPIERRKADVVYDGQKTSVRAWIWDVAEDAQGRPVIVYTRLPAETDHRYHYARWDGQAWQDVQLCEAGKWFPKTPEGKTEPEPHYSGGIVLDHADPSVVYLSRPVSGAFQIERWSTTDNGKTWKSVLVTRGSDRDSVRPFVVRDHQPDGPTVLWMSNRKYVHYTNYDSAIRMDLLGVQSSAPSGRQAAAAVGRLQDLTVPDGLGVNIHFTGEPKDLDSIAEAGFRFIRMDLSWSGVEREKGIYDFEKTGYDALTAGCEKRGLRILYILDYSNDLYEADHSVRTEQGRRAFAAFTAAAARRYAGKRILWEIWNEPNIKQFWNPQPGVEDYCKLVEAAAAAVRKADPSGLVVAPATSTIPFAWLEDCFKNGLLNWIDALSVHPYRPQAPETVIKDYGRLRELMRRYAPQGKEIPILSGEWGYSTVNWDNTRLSAERQGQYLARMFLTDLYQNVPISIWYDWKDDGTDPNEREHHFGTVTGDLKPKQAYLAAKTLASTLAGYAIKDRIDVGGDKDFVLRLVRGSAEALAFWTTGEDHELTLPLKAGGGTMLDMLGNRADRSWQGGGLKVRVSQSPAYLLIRGP